MAKSTARPADERFWAMVTRSDGCWEYTGHISDKGYGKFTPGDGESSRRAHRFAYELLVGPIPPGKQLDHLCHTRDQACPGGSDCMHRRCVNPSHLEPVTSRENTMRSNVAPCSVNARKTRCPQGHPYSGPNLYVHRGDRHCRTCMRETTLRYRQLTR